MDFGKITKQAHDVHEQVRKLNMECSKLNGIAGKIPANAPFPLDRFIGDKVILSNVGYSFKKCCVVASVKMPYGDKGSASTYSGRVLEFEITKDWFK